ncbi:hypothetical protein ACFLZC_00800 [Patescibacteria group bacterium]
MLEKEDITKIIDAQKEVFITKKDIIENFATKEELTDIFVTKEYFEELRQDFRSLQSSVDAYAKKRMDAPNC